jgi:hypothetical protein
VGNAYLAHLRAQYAELEASVKSITDKAFADGKRSLTDNERGLVTKMGEQMTGMAADIKTLADQERENAQIAATEREIAALTGGQRQGPEGQFGSDSVSDATRGNMVPVGGARTEPRDPGHYRRTGNTSLFRDISRAKKGDATASRRLVESSQFTLQERGLPEDQVRDLTTSSAGGGVIAPKWMTELFAQRASMGRPLTNAITNIPLGNDPRPMTLPKETVDAPVGVQAAELDAPVSSPDWDSDTDTVTPITITGKQKVSRQMIDSATPAVDQLLFQSLVRKRDALVERRTVLAIEQANPTLMTASGSVAITDATHYNKRIIRAMTQVFATRLLPPDLIFGSPRRFGMVLELTDTTGRQVVLPGFNMGPQNAAGVANLGSAFAGSVWHGTQFIASPGELDDGRLYTLGRDDAVYFESDLLRFTYEEKSGPEAIELGIWGYSAWWVMYKPDSVQGLTITGDGESA